MVAVIGSGTSIKRAFLYNENKVKAGVARCLAAVNYPLELVQLSQQQRLNMLQKVADLNPDVKRKSIHISLNFAPGEALSDTRLQQIARDYMEQIGFGNQPFLVYRHEDTAHPHIHIVTTKIRPDGSRIDTQYIGKLRSEPARKLLEKRYHLVKAEQQKQLHILKPVDVMRVAYGQIPTKKAINNVLQSVLQDYKFTSLAELNAVLELYHIKAHPGNEGSRILQHQGLFYQVLDERGKPVGTPVKASAFYNNPGIRFLEKQYLKNDVQRQAQKAQLKSTIDQLLLQHPKADLQVLVNKLKSQGIHLCIRQNNQGLIYGLTYVDHRTRCVFNGSSLGKKYSAKGLLEQLSSIAGKPIVSQSKPAITRHQQTPSLSSTAVSSAEPESRQADAPIHLLDDLLGFTSTDPRVSLPFRRRKKRKKKN